MNKEMKLIKESNVRLAEKVVKVQENERALSIKVNRMENFLKGNNSEIQGVTVSEIKKILKRLTWLFWKLLIPPYC